MSVFWGVIILVGILLLIFCLVMLLKPKTAQKKCSKDSDCPKGEKCLNGKCASPTPPKKCSKDSDCPDGGKCSNGVCVAGPCPPCDIGKTCDTSSLKCIDWTPPTCSLRGTFTQLCGDPSNPLPCGSSDKTTRLDIGSCSCNSYFSNYQQATVNYKGNNCQYDDNTTCNSNGSVDNTGHCSCGSYQSTSTTRPGQYVQYVGSHCQYSDTNCNNFGISSVDVNDNLVCACDADHVGPTCSQQKGIMLLCSGGDWNTCQKGVQGYDDFAVASDSHTPPCNLTFKSYLNGKKVTGRTNVDLSVDMDAYSNNGVSWPKSHSSVGVQNGLLYFDNNTDNVIFQETVIPEPSQCPSV